VAGGVLCRGGEGEEAQSQVYSEKKAARGVLGAPLTVEGFTTAEAAGQRRWRARTEAQCSDSDVVGFGHGRRLGRDGCARGEARRGEGGVGSAAASSDTAGRKRPVRTAFNPHGRIQTSPPMAANQGAARGDTATDRWAPRVSVFPY
jgi:hypothetical protein